MADVWKKKHGKGWRVIPEIYGTAIWVNYGADEEWWVGEKIRENI